MVECYLLYFISSCSFILVFSAYLGGVHSVMLLMPSVFFILSTANGVVLCFLQ